MVSSVSNQGGNPLGNSIIKGVDGFNRMLNTPAISSVGQAFNATGILTPVHFLADSLGYGAMKAMEGIGRALGGKGDIDYHMKEEWGIGGSSQTKRPEDAERNVGGRHGWDRDDCKTRVPSHRSEPDTHRACLNRHHHQTTMKTAFAIESQVRVEIRS
jgi:hypothetical protein